MHNRDEVALINAGNDRGIMQCDAVSPMERGEKPRAHDPSSSRGLCAVYVDFQAWRSETETPHTFLNCSRTVSQELSIGRLCWGAGFPQRRV